MTLTNTKKALALLPVAGRIMARILNWTDVERHVYIEQFAEELAGHIEQITKSANL